MLFGIVIFVQGGVRTDGFAGVGKHWKQTLQKWDFFNVRERAKHEGHETVPAMRTTTKVIKKGG